ncbi:hypothetical protein GCM10009678_73140 [Actinomadura kijaniata]
MLEGGQRAQRTGPGLRSADAFEQLGSQAEGDGQPGRGEAVGDAGVGGDLGRTGRTQAGFPSLHEASGDQGPLLRQRAEEGRDLLRAPAGAPHRVDGLQVEGREEAWCCCGVAMPGWCFPWNGSVGEGARVVEGGVSPSASSAPPTAVPVAAAPVVAAAVSRARRERRAPGRSDMRDSPRSRPALQVS